MFMLKTFSLDKSLMWDSSYWYNVSKSWTSCSEAIGPDERVLRHEKVKRATVKFNDKTLKIVFYTTFSSNLICAIEFSICHPDFFMFATACRETSTILQFC